jgi:hypothetical protein
MRDTGDIRTKLLTLWEKFDKGELDATTARTHIGFARATLDTLKVEIAAAHLSSLSIPVITLSGGVSKHPEELSQVPVARSRSVRGKAKK